MIRDGSTINSPSTPLWLLLELTYKCPLQCPYCSNSTQFAQCKNELSTSEWIDVLVQARKLGALQLGLSGGEPLTRCDLEEIIKAAHDLGYYTNLITSTMGMTQERLVVIKNAGIDAIQISFQSSDQQQNDYYAQTHCFEHKVAMAQAVKKLQIPFTFNLVLHRHNIDKITDHIEFAIALGADYIELANTQYLGFAFENRHYLLPTRDQMKQAEIQVKQYQACYQNQPKIYFVIADYFEGRPTPCMNGWGTTFMTINPEGDVLPCHAAKSLPHLNFPNIRERTLDWIWHHSDLFNQYRGYEWMKEPCASCPERFKDFAGCRCQAFLLTGDAAMTDPACSLSSHHQLINVSIDHAQNKNQKILFRNAKLMRKNEN